ncbi:MAG: protein kinase [Myxococcales bacterium]|nr:protein kinase [Myxococcales bacterium]
MPAGTIIAGRYRIVRLLGEGGMGAVYEAVQLPIGRRCALKTLLPALARDPASVARFEREARAAASLGHPNIVQVTDFLWEGGIPVLVMELLEGRSLGAVLRDEGRVAPQRAAFVASQVLLALEAAHRAGIVHRDIKPDNVFLTSISGMTDIVKVVDWGIAKLDAGAPGGAATELTTAGSMLGSPAYMSPEQARGAGIDLRTDVYGVGALLYRAIGGRLPYEATSMNALLFAIAEQTPTPLTRIAQVDPRLSEIVERAMAKDPSARFQSAAELHAALAPFATPSPMVGASPAAGGVGAAPPPAAGGASFAATTVPPGPIFGAAPPPTQAPMVATGTPPTQAPMAATGTPPTLGSPMAPPPRAMAPAPPAPRSSSGALWAIFAVLVLIVLLLGAGGAGAAYYFATTRPPGSVAVVATTTPSAPSAPSARASATAGDLAAATPSATLGPSATAGVVAPLDAGPRAPTTPTPTAPTAPTASAPTIPTSPPPRDAGAPGLAGGARADFNGCTCNEFEVDGVRAGVGRVAGPLNACYAKSQYDGVDHQFQGWDLDVDATGRVTAVRPIGGTTRCTNVDACAMPVLRMMTFGPSKNRAPGNVRLYLKSRRPDNP